MYAMFSLCLLYLLESVRVLTFKGIPAEGVLGWFWSEESLVYQVFEFT
jgi:hypothetical protein